MGRTEYSVVYSYKHSITYYGRSISKRASKRGISDLDTVEGYSNNKQAIKTKQLTAAIEMTTDSGQDSIEALTEQPLIQEVTEGDPKTITASEELTVLDLTTEHTEVNSLPVKAAEKDFTLSNLSGEDTENE
jgi:hypothetical protein